MRPGHSEVREPGATGVSYHAPLPLVVRDWATREPGRLFLREVDGPAQTYGETHDQALTWARAMHARGVFAGDRVLVFMPSKLETINLWIGLGWLRAVYVPINTEYRGSALRYIVDNAKAKILVCAERYLSYVLDVLDEIALDTIIVWRETPASLPDDPRTTFVDLTEVLRPADGSTDVGDGPALHETSAMMYTSGTTGASKGVMIPWGSFANAGHRAGPPGGFASDDVFYSTLPMFHVGGTNWLHGIAGAGGTWVFRERFSTSAFWDDVRRYSCTTTFLLGAMANFLGRSDERPDDAENSMRTVVAVPLPENIDAFERRFGLRAYTMYGSTEIGIAMKPGLERVDDRSCGRPLPEYEARVVDDFDHEVPHGRMGELVMRPRRPWTSFSGYFEMPEATAEAWRNLWFHTGDGFRRNESGDYYFVDRIKDSIRRRGENISSAEVEAYVFRHQAVLECAVIPAPSEWGEEEVKACVVVKPGHELTEAALIEFLRAGSMPRFMVPRFVEFIEELPKTPTGKIQKNLLRDQASKARGWDREMQERPARGTQAYPQVR